MKVKELLAAINELKATNEYVLEYEVVVPLYSGGYTPYLGLMKCDKIDKVLNLGE